MKKHSKIVLAKRYTNKQLPLRQVKKYDLEHALKGVNYQKLRLQGRGDEDGGSKVPMGALSNLAKNKRVIRAVKAVELRKNHRLK